MKQKTAAQPMQWPRMMTEQDFQLVLNKGNRRPSPGPDHWEKWALKQTSADFREILRTLCNYTIAHNYFPDRLKQNYISPLYKRNDETDPNNYRGIVFANCLYNLVSSWYTISIQRYVWNLGLLPDTQIATQQHLQIGDLTMFLSEIDEAAKLNNQTLNAIKRDHTKGFDYLSADAFADAVNFYGLPQALIDFERNRTANISLQVKSQDGVSPRRIRTTGQTKQGDPASPIKYTLSMGMLTHWLESSATRFPSITTHQAHKRHLHTPADRYALRLSCVEAMDNSIWFAQSWDSLRITVQDSERFQEAYGIRTAWEDKTTCFLLGKVIDYENVADLAITFKGADGTEHQVPYEEEPRMLRTLWNKPKHMLDNIISIVDDFALPQGLPMPIIRRAVWGVLLPRIRAKLSLQPLLPKQALAVDHAIARKVARSLQCPGTTSEILSIPLKQHGFGFPSVHNINGEIAIKSLLRALNHHQRSFCVTAAITLANWTCYDNHCVSPLERWPAWQHEQRH